MYEENYLANRLRAASLGREAAVFLQNHQTGQATSYGAFFANAERMAAVLVAAGVKPGDRVAVQAPKTEAMLELYVGAVLAGAVFLPLNTAYTVREISYFLEDATPALLVCDPANYAALLPVATESGVGTVLTLAADEAGTLPARRDTQKAGFAAAPRAADDLAAILYTSGTTGRSKGAMLTHRALASNAETLKDYWRFTREDVLIHALPIYHTHGLFVATNISMLAGSACIFMNGFNAEAIRACMPRATALMGVPTFYVRLLGTEGLAEAAQKMRLFISGSAPLLAETHDRWRAVTGHAILERYGMTETNMNTSNPYEGERRAGTVGFALPGVDLAITNPETGEKVAQGYISIVGRAKDLIITGGFNVYPKEVELLIDDIDGVVESAVIGVPDADFGEAVVAIVVLEAGAALDEPAILAAIAPDLARFKQPKRVVVVDALIRNTMGKVQKNKLRAQYGP